MALKFLTTYEVSRKVGLPSWEVAAMTHREEFPKYVEVNGKWRFVEHEIEEWMHEHIEYRDAPRSLGGLRPNAD